MTITAQDAAAALSEIEQARVETRTLRGYQFAGSFLILWGLVWIAAGTAIQFTLAKTNAVWLLADAVGILGSFYIGFTQSKRYGDNKQFMWRFLGVCALIGGFTTAVLFTFAPITSAQAMSFSGLMCGTIYMAVGLWFGARYLALGVAVFAATVIGFTLFPDQAMVMIAWAGGAALLLGGLWMRSA